MSRWILICRAKILLKPDGTVDKVVIPERLDAHRLIEEMMILANVAAAETLSKEVRHWSTAFMISLRSPSRRRSVTSCAHSIFRLQRAWR